MTQQSQPQPQMIIDYYITYNVDRDDLMQQVRGLILRGWQPFGGAFSAQQYNSAKLAMECVFCQTLVLYAPPLAPPPAPLPTAIDKSTTQGISSGGSGSPNQVKKGGTK